MPLANISPPILESVDPIQFLATFAVFVVMVSVIAACGCCGLTKQQTRKQKDECDYGVVTVSSGTNLATKPSAVHSINFRDNTSKRIHERHSQPASVAANALTFNRQSAPGRALPKLPADLYTAIDKKSKRDDDIRFADEAINPMYECIDAETDSFVDPLYSKVGNVPGTTAARDRYDYPIFMGKHSKNANDDMVYQSASQVYAANSEDPYSSIVSEREKNDGDGDNSSAYDPGYAKVNLAQKKNPNPIKKKDPIEKTERELDLLYSKIRRNVTTYPDDNMPGPSRVETILPVFQQVEIPPQAPFDGQSAVSSREPSYRYITMRENAEIVRERLRQQGRLDRPIREHYYSTIGNEYESIANGNNVAEARPVLIHNQAPLANISTSSTSDAPPPPTSPIPERSRPVSYIDSYDSINVNGSIPPVPDLRRSPVPPKPPGTEHVYSISNALSTRPRPYDHHEVYTTAGNHQPNTSNYRSLETLLGRRTFEEKETIVEQRSTFTTGVPVPTTSHSNNIMSRSMDTPIRPVHEVPIRRLDRNYDGGPGADVIISGRRYRSGAGLVEDSSPPQATLATHDVDVEAGVVEASDLNKPSTSDKVTTENEEDPEYSKIQKPSKKSKSWKDETEEEKVQRLGSIYTSKDYVCQLDMTDQKPWPMSNNNK